MSLINPLTNAIDMARTIAQQALSSGALQPTQLQSPLAPALFQGYQPEPAYHPQVAPQTLQATSPGSGGPAASNYGPEGFSQHVHGQQAQELDVDFMRMSHAAYGGEVDTAGWTEVTRQDLIDNHGWDADVLLDVPESQFSATVFTDNDGNYVLAYRGTADGTEDWITNFEQGAGLETTSGEFELLAPQVAQQFAQALGDGGPGQAHGNLAITGHSQGGGLAAVGSAVTGIPAVTFDASGVHPATFERLDLDIDAVRENAGDGQIRRYSMYEDALTQLQENIPGVSLLVPEAVGHQIVVKPEGGLETGMIDRALEHPAMPDGVTREMLETVPGLEQLARAIISHDQQFMIDTMQQQQPWQDGYTNPEAPGGARLNDLVPQSVQDDYQLNVGDLVEDVQEVVGNQFANGDYVEGAISILGDVGEGFLNSVGDTVDGYAGEFADGVRQQTGDWADSLQGQGPWGVGTLGSVVIESLGDAGATVIEGGGSAFEWAGDRLGEGFEAIADAGGQRAQQAVDGFVSTVNAIGDGAGYVADAVATGTDYALDAVQSGWNTVSNAAVETWDNTVETATSAWDGAVDTATSAWDNTTDTISDGISWVGDRLPWNR